MANEMNAPTIKDQLMEFVNVHPDATKQDLIANFPDVPAWLLTNRVAEVTSEEEVLQIREWIQLNLTFNPSASGSSSSSNSVRRDAVHIGRNFLRFTMKSNPRWR